MNLKVAFQKAYHSINQLPTGYHSKNDMAHEIISEKNLENKLNVFAACLSACTYTA